MKTKLKIHSLLLVALLTIIGCQEKGKMQRESILGLLALNATNQNQSNELILKRKASDELIQKLSSGLNSEQGIRVFEDRTRIFADFIRNHVEISEIKESASRVGNLDQKYVDVLVGLELKSDLLADQLKELDTNLEIPEVYRNQKDNFQTQSSRFGQWSTSRVEGWFCMPENVFMQGEFWPAAIHCWLRGAWFGFHTWLRFDSFWQ